jgi:hypothetical protein
MITCIRTDSDNKDFQKLVLELDADLRIRDGKSILFLHSSIKLIVSGTL